MYVWSIIYIVEILWIRLIRGFRATIESHRIVAAGSGFSSKFQIGLLRNAHYVLLCLGWKHLAVDGHVRHRVVVYSECQIWRYAPMCRYAGRTFSFWRSQDLAAHEPCTLQTQNYSDRDRGPYCKPGRATAAILAPVNTVGELMYCCSSPKCAVKCSGTKIWDTAIIGWKLRIFPTPLIWRTRSLSSPWDFGAVSYTHLTLPTKRIV